MITKSKIITECPACHSHDIKQLLDEHYWPDNGYSVSGIGSYCNNCGIRFLFDTPHLEQDIKKELTSYKKILNKVKAKSAKEAIKKH